MIIAASRVYLILFLCLLLWLLYVLGQENAPNIILIISDDQGWADYGFMNHPTILTPNIDKLAAEGVVFRHGYVPTPLCRPSLMTLATGYYPFQHGVTGNRPPVGSNNSDEINAAIISKIDRLKTLPELLGQQGYISFQTGKWWEGSYARGGFTHGMTRGFPEPGGRHGDDGLLIGREGMVPIAKFIDLAKREDKPFFIWYAPFLPHRPHNPPKRHLELYSSDGKNEHINNYQAMCTWLDETCGSLIDILEKEGVRDNTFIIYVTDNGWIQDPNSVRYAARSKLTPYEGGVRTPIIFSWPDKLKATERSEVISSVDIVPTILAAAGARVPEDLPGLNLLPYLQSKKKIERESIFGEVYSNQIFEVNNPEASLIYRWVIHGRWKLILTYDLNRNKISGITWDSNRAPQLFDLIKDPLEKNNIAGKHPKVVENLASLLAEWNPLKERKPSLK